MNRIVRWLRIGGATVAAAVIVATAYVGLCFLSYGSYTRKGLDLPEWFTVGFDYAIDETPLRWPILRIAGWIRLRDEHESLSEQRRMKEWAFRWFRSKRGAAQNGLLCGDRVEWKEKMNAYYARCETSFFASSELDTDPPMASNDAVPLAFGEGWEELIAWRSVRQAERRCQE